MPIGVGRKSILAHGIMATAVRCRFPLSGSSLCKKRRELQLSSNVQKSMSQQSAPSQHTCYILSERLSATRIKQNTRGSIWPRADLTWLAGCLHPRQRPYLGYRLPTRPSYLRCLELRGQLLQIHRNVES